MALIKTVKPDEAEGAVKKVYDAILEKMPFVPKPLQLMSASEPVLGVYFQTLGYFMEHPRLGVQTLSAIRLLVALESSYPYCIDMNSKLLQLTAGLSDEQLAAVRSDPASLPLPDKEQALVLFVLKVIKTPEAVEVGDLAALREHGWTDQDIFEASYHGVGMVGAGILFNAFKMQQEDGPSY